ncbi:putative flavonol 3-O-glucosyltransferase [Lupinus albus]|uniref:Glycosyltransferase n=1 Tax=Lupinus albus TaxID=3870 RepID=A0A6A4PVV0_LUPAL|nr:putative flavonol 3-O-glucosyltransferase [Lupinus albus]
MTTSETHLVFVPSPGMGHLVSTVEFAKLLINRDHRLSITILVMKTPYDTVTSSYTDTLSSSLRLHVINLPHSQTTTDPNNSSSPMTTLIASNKPHVRDHVNKLVHNSSRLGALVVDMFCTTMIDVAREFHVPAFVFFTSGAAFLGLVLHLHTLRQRDNIDVTELKDTDTEFVIPSFANSVPAKVFPSIVLTKEWDPFFLTYSEGLKNADGILVNSFDELEPHALQSFSDINNNKIPLYPVGPILNIKDKESDDVSDTIMKWLNDQPPCSVIFLCFGSMGSFDVDQVREIARAVEASGARFIWSLRKPPPKGFNIMAPPSIYTAQELVEVLPGGFLDRTAEIGRVIGWAPQAQVLAHKATAGFVSHCGWNSTLESIYFGVPIATWPLYAEQQTNAFELVRELNLGVEITLDYRVGFKVGSSSVLSAQKIERGIRDLLQKDEVRKKVKEMSEKSRKTLIQGGSSYSHLGRFIDYIIN